MNVGNESDEVTNRGIKDTESRCWISLRVWCVRKISDRFQTDHGGDLVAAPFASTSVNKTPHLLRQKIRRFFVRKRDKTQRVLCRSSGETARQGGHCRNAAAIVIGPVGAEDQARMRAHERHAG